MRPCLRRIGVSAAAALCVFLGNAAAAAPVLVFDADPPNEGSDTPPEISTSLSVSSDGIQQTFTAHPSLHGWNPANGTWDMSELQVRLQVNGDSFSLPFALYSATANNPNPLPGSTLIAQGSISVSGSDTGAWYSITDADTATGSLPTGLTGNEIYTLRLWKQNPGDAVAWMNAWNGSTPEDVEPGGTMYLNSNGFLFGGGTLDGPDLGLRVFVDEPIAVPEPRALALAAWAAAGLLLVRWAAKTAC